MSATKCSVPFGKLRIASRLMISVLALSLLGNVWARSCSKRISALFVITNIFTEVITNNAAAALAFPLAVSISNKLGMDPTPFFVCICFAASAAFSTPIGYQTNLIVQGVGGYKFKDFVKVGLPLNIIVFLMSVFLIPLFYC